MPVSPIKDLKGNADRCGSAVGERWLQFERAVSNPQDNERIRVHALPYVGQVQTHQSVGFSDCHQGSLDIRDWSGNPHSPRKRMTLAHDGNRILWSEDDALRIIHCGFYSLLRIRRPRYAPGIV
jgi:hypothetical protein